MCVVSVCSGVKSEGKRMCVICCCLGEFLLSYHERWVTYALL